MKENLQKYAYHLDYLRREYNLTENQLCENICDPRSYRRYISGERKLPYKKIFEFCNRLGITTSDFFYNSQVIERVELKKIRELYKHVVNRKFDEFYSEKKHIHSDRLLNKQNYRYYMICNIIADYQTHKIYDRNAISKMAKVIDYPACIDKKIYDFIEITGLNFIAEIEIKTKEKKALNKLYSLLKQKESIYINSESENVLPRIYANISLFLGRLAEYKNSLDIADAGIEYCKGFSDLSSLSHLRYMKAFCLKMLGYKEESEIEAIRCLCISYGKDNKYESKMFRDTLIKDFGFNPLDLIKKYENHLL